MSPGLPIKGKWKDHFLVEGRVFGFVKNGTYTPSEIIGYCL